MSTESIKSRLGALIEQMQELYDELDKDDQEAKPGQIVYNIPSVNIIDNHDELLSMSNYYGGDFGMLLRDVKHDFYSTINRMDGLREGECIDIRPRDVSSSIDTYRDLLYINLFLVAFLACTIEFRQGQVKIIGHKIPTGYIKEFYTRFDSEDIIRYTIEKEKYDSADGIEYIKRETRVGILENSGYNIMCMLSRDVTNNEFILRLQKVGSIAFKMLSGIGSGMSHERVMQNAIESYIKNIHEEVMCYDSSFGVSKDIITY